MSEQSIDALARTLAYITVAELMLIPLVIGSFFIPTRRFGCMVWLLRLALLVPTVVVGMALVFVAVAL